jgi:ribosome biogenesis protein MAK21
MKPIVAREISALVLKPVVLKVDQKTNSKSSDDPHLRYHDHARYYGTITLNQIPLDKGEPEVSNKLIQLYFELFNDILGKAETEEEEKGALEQLEEKNEEDLEAEHLQEQQATQKHAKGKKGHKKNSTGKSSKEIAEEETIAERKAKLIAAILTGLNRAFPYGSIENSILKGYMDTLFRISHTGALGVSIQALILLQHLLKSKPDLTDRFYRVLYGTLIDHRLLTAPSKHGLYLNLLFKSIKADPNQARILAFVKRVVQILPYHQPPFICSAIVLLGHVSISPPFTKNKVTFLYPRIST